MFLTWLEWNVNQETISFAANVDVHCTDESLTHHFIILERLKTVNKETKRSKQKTDIDKKKRRVYSIYL